jgi:hypothetical protein
LLVEVLVDVFAPVPVLNCAEWAPKTAASWVTPNPVAMEMLVSVAQSSWAAFASLSSKE